MKKALSLIWCSLLVVSLADCATHSLITHPTEQVHIGAGVTPSPPYLGPKARIAVADFEVKTAKVRHEIGSGLREMLVTGLINSNCFSVVERQTLGTVMQGQGSVAAGADLIITAIVTEFEPQSSGGREGVGGGGSAGSGVLGALLGATLNKAHMALDMHIVDASTSKVLTATIVQGQASDISGTIMGGSLGNWGLSRGLSAYANTPMEKAIRICIVEAVRYISQAIPKNYYKY